MISPYLSLFASSRSGSFCLSRGNAARVFFCPVVSTLVVEEVPCHASRLGRVAGGVAAAEALSCNARICREPLRVWRLPIVWNEVDHTQDRSCLYKDICSIMRALPSTFHQLYFTLYPVRALFHPVRPSIILRGIKLTPKPQYATRDHCNESGSQLLAPETHGRKTVLLKSS